MQPKWSRLKWKLAKKAHQKCRKIDRRRLKEKRDRPDGIILPDRN